MAARVATVAFSGIEVLVQISGSLLDRAVGESRESKTLGLGITPSGRSAA